MRWNPLHKEWLLTILAIKSTFCALLFQLIWWNNIKRHTDKQWSPVLPQSSDILNFPFYLKLEAMCLDSDSWQCTFCTMYHNLESLVSWTMLLRRFKILRDFKFTVTLDPKEENNQVTKLYKLVPSVDDILIWNEGLYVPRIILTHVGCP